MTIRRTWLAAVIAVCVAATLLSSRCSFYQNSSISTLVIMYMPGDNMPKATPDPATLGMKVEAYKDAKGTAIMWQVIDNRYQVVSVESYDPSGRKSNLSTDGSKPVSIREGMFVYLQVQSI